MTIKKLFILLAVMFMFLSFNSCGGRESLSEIDKTLQESTTVKIYSIDIDKLNNSNNVYARLHDFPFISTDAMLDFRGNFPIEFYQSMRRFKVNAKNIKDVDFWKLRDYPFTLDVIYVKPVWLENFKYVSNDLFENICYSFNLSKREQAILKWWLKNGGILWLETGIYATGFEELTKYGRVNLKIIKKKINVLTNNLHFIDFPVSTITYISKYTTLSGYKPKTITFRNIKISRNFFKDIDSLKIILRYPVETFFSIPKGSIIEDRYGNPMLSIIPYYEGKIIFLFPFEYVDSYRNGELLRWKLLQYIYSEPHYSNPMIQKINDNKSINLDNNSLKEQTKEDNSSKNITNKNDS